MNSRFLLILLAMLVIVSGVVWTVYTANQEALVNLEGQVLRVRTYPLTPEASIVIADFRVRNPDAVPFVVHEVAMTLEQPNGETIEAQMLTAGDINRMFAYQKLAGPQYNDPLLVQDRVPAGESWDRMAAGRIDLPEQQIGQRANLHIRIEEIDGLASTISEDPGADNGSTGN